MLRLDVIRKLGRSVSGEPALVATQPEVVVVILIEADGVRAFGLQSRDLGGRLLGDPCLNLRGLRFDSLLRLRRGWNGDVWLLHGSDVVSLGNVVSLAQVSVQPGPDEGREVGTPGAHEHAEMLGLDVEVQVRLRIEDFLAHHAVVQIARLVVDRHLDKSENSVAIASLVEDFALTGGVFRDLTLYIGRQLLIK